MSSRPLSLTLQTKNWCCFFCLAYQGLYLSQNLLLAGVNTSASTVVWAMAELARNPIVMKKAQAEVRSVIGNKGKVTESDLDQLLYFKLVVKETFRLHPPSPLLLPRETMSHFQMNGYHIHPKTRVHVNVWAIGRDPNVWKNPKEFFPESFIDNSIDFKGQYFELLPFGAGRRVCPAINMGIAMLELTFANLLYHFNWKLPHGMKEEDINMEEGAGITSPKKFAFILRPTQYPWPCFSLWRKLIFFIFFVGLLTAIHKSLFIDESNGKLWILNGCYELILSITCTHLQMIGYP